MLGTETKERLQRWVKHFSEKLKRDDPTNPVKEDGMVESEDIKEIDLGRRRSQEVKHALKRTKPGRAPGVDNVCSKLLRADIKTLQVG